MFHPPDRRFRSTTGSVRELTEEVLSEIRCEYRRNWFSTHFPVCTGIKRWPHQRLRYLDAKLLSLLQNTGPSAPLSDAIEKVVAQRRALLNGVPAGELAFAIAYHLGPCVVLVADNPEQLSPRMRARLSDLQIEVDVDVIIEPIAGREPLNGIDGPSSAGKAMRQSGSATSTGSSTTPLGPSAYTSHRSSLAGPSTSIAGPGTTVAGFARGRPESLLPLSFGSLGTGPGLVAPSTPRDWRGPVADVLLDPLQQRPLGLPRAMPLPLPNGLYATPAVGSLLPFGHDPQAAVFGGGALAMPAAMGPGVGSGVPGEKDPQMSFLMWRFQQFGRTRGLML